MASDAIKRKVSKAVVIFSTVAFILDLSYRTKYNISFINRDRCILYRKLPRLGFLFYEYFFELFIAVVVGVFLAVLLEQFFSRYGHFYPNNPLSAFLYASVLPVCACAVIPLLGPLRNRIKLSTLVTFVVAAPLLSPYILFLSMTVLGPVYVAFRVAGAFVLAAATGLTVGYLHREDEHHKRENPVPCLDPLCLEVANDKWLKTYDVLRGIWIWVVAAGAIGIITELYLPPAVLASWRFPNNAMGVLAAILVGIPIYFCNGAEVLLLRPLIHNSGLGSGTAVAFSLASAAICVTSIVLIARFLGKRSTTILVAALVVFSLVIGMTINTLAPDTLFRLPLK